MLRASGLNPPAEKPAGNSGDLRTIALIGPPNSGKSTLVQPADGAAAEGGELSRRNGRAAHGTMAGVGRAGSDADRSAGDLFAGSHIQKTRGFRSKCCAATCRARPKPDAVLLVLDSLHLTRQLMLAAPVLALGLPTMVLLNMSDLMDARGGGGGSAAAGAGAGSAGGVGERDEGDGAGSRFGCF